MKAPSTNRGSTAWQDVHDAVLDKIRSGEWKPGDAIPNEVDMARDFDCARATVNRALRELAEAGLLERRRKAGTRVAPYPSRRARLHIPLIREEIEGRGARYGYRLLARNTLIAPSPVCARMDCEAGTRLMHISALHLSDGAPFAHEARWINPAAIGGVEDADFTKISPNEWLVRNAPFSEGEIALMSTEADKEVAEALGTATGAALFILERTTRTVNATITFVRISYAPGYKMRMTL